MKKKLIIAGGSGLLGHRLIEMLDKDKYDIYVLSRSKTDREGAVSFVKWDTDKNYIELPEEWRPDIIINLAGAGIADKRWSADRKRIILESRVNSARTLEIALSGMNVKPEVFVSASAIGYYGDRGEEILTEESTGGNAFLPEVCTVWEEANVSSASKAERQVMFRIGIVLSTKGGALAEILKTTATGVYGYFGDGSAYYSWIHIDDLCRMMIQSIEDENYRGIYNGTAENPVTIKELVRDIKKAKRGIGPLLPVPAFILKLAMGEMASMLLASMRVVPKKALSQGFKFKFSKAQCAIEDLIERKI